MVEKDERNSPRKATLAGYSTPVTESPRIHSRSSSLSASYCHTSNTTRKQNTENVIDLSVLSLFRIFSVCLVLNVLTLYMLIILRLVQPEFLEIISSLSLSVQIILLSLFSITIVVCYSTLKAHRRYLQVLGAPYSIYQDVEEKNKAYRHFILTSRITWILRLLTIAAFTHQTGVSLTPLLPAIFLEYVLFPCSLLQRFLWMAATAFFILWEVLIKEANNAWYTIAWLSFLVLIAGISKIMQRTTRMHYHQHADTVNALQELQRNVVKLFTSSLPLELIESILSGVLPQPRELDTVVMYFRLIEPPHRDKMTNPRVEATTLHRVVCALDMLVKVSPGIKKVKTTGHNYICASRHKGKMGMGPDSPQHAVEFACSAVEVALAMGWRVAGGITCGRLVSGVLGSGKPVSFDVFGDVVNLSARIAWSFKDGLKVGPALQRALRVRSCSKWWLGNVEVVPLKGKGRCQLYRVLWSHQKMVAHTRHLIDVKADFTIRNDSLMVERISRDSRMRSPLSFDRIPFSQFAADSTSTKLAEKFDMPPGLVPGVTGLPTLHTTATREPHSPRTITRTARRHKLEPFTCTPPSVFRQRWANLSTHLAGRKYSPADIGSMPHQWPGVILFMLLSVTMSPVLSQPKGWLLMVPQLLAIVAQALAALNVYSPFVGFIITYTLMIGAGGASNVAFPDSISWRRLTLLEAQMGMLIIIVRAIFAGFNLDTRFSAWVTIFVSLIHFIVMTTFGYFAAGLINFLSIVGVLMFALVGTDIINQKLSKRIALEQVFQRTTEILSHVIPSHTISDALAIIQGTKIKELLHQTAMPVTSDVAKAPPTAWRRMLIGYTSHKDTNLTGDSDTARLNRSIRSLLAREPFASSDVPARRLRAIYISADIANFTTFSAESSMRALLLLLNTTFTRFDRLLEQSILPTEGWRVKTVGDCFEALVLLQPGEERVLTERATLLALRFISEFRSIVLAQQPQWVGQLDLRVGVDSGTFLSAMVGCHRIVSDVFGTVPAAADRIQSMAPPGGCLVSPSVIRELMRSELLELEPFTVNSLSASAPRVELAQVSMARGVAPLE
eukprot:gnl/Dysnectes_brevis/4788_a6602_411.p1 GENE.gnl/Dysnectes_brevis/4788_a6602_411~~gnl/Dysnectes_brevis/4788_a6602_411.p1  ORF type:complete len:1132 (-),score=361.61 gnl/Dysnectes_brevis/4788_a6602_411:61-3267(-)